jgi:hypothetical protein
VGAPEL